MKDERDPSGIIDPETGLPRTLKEKCATCVFRSGNLMHLGKGRLKEMADGANANGSWIKCHETLEYGPYPDFGEAICRGFYDTNATKSWGIRLALVFAERLGLKGLPEVDPPPDPREENEAQP